MGAVKLPCYGSPSSTDRPVRPEIGVCAVNEGGNLAANEGKRRRMLRYVVRITSASTVQTNTAIGEPF